MLGGREVLCEKEWWKSNKSTWKRQNKSQGLGPAEPIGDKSHFHETHQSQTFWTEWASFIFWPQKHHVKKWPRHLSWTSIKHTVNFLFCPPNWLICMACVNSTHRSLIVPLKGQACLSLAVEKSSTCSTNQCEEQGCSASVRLCFYSRFISVFKSGKILTYQ